MSSESNHLDEGPTPESQDVLGRRLGQQAQRLRLLLVHLAGPAVRAWVDIEDLAQEVFVRALVSSSVPAADALDPDDTQLWRFLTRLGRNTVIDVARAIAAAKRSGKTASLQHSDWSSAGPRVSQIAAVTWGPATRLGAKELEESLEQRFCALTPEHKEVIGLRQFEGLSARETAQRMGRGEAAVHSLYRRALQAWQESGRLDESHDESGNG